MIDHVISIAASVDSLKNSIMAADEPTEHKDLMNIKARLSDFETQFKNRMLVITGTEV
jgi:hypothetical protein